MMIKLKVNGVEKNTEICAGDMLVDILRREGHVEVKKGCDSGSCGVCTVLIDGVPVPSCSYLAARADSRDIVTIRGVLKEADEFAAFLAAEGADQCGFCAPGFALTVIAMKRELGTKATDDQIRHYLSGNLCRCSGYEGQLRAIRKYLEASRD